MRPYQLPCLFYVCFHACMNVCTGAGFINVVMPFTAGEWVIHVPVGVGLARHLIETLPITGSRHGLFVIWPGTHTKMTASIFV